MRTSEFSNALREANVFYITHHKTWSQESRRGRSIAPRVWLVLVGLGWGELSDARPHLEKKARSNEPADCVCVSASFIVQHQAVMEARLTSVSGCSSCARGEDAVLLADQYVSISVSRHRWQYYLLSPHLALMSPCVSYSKAYFVQYMILTWWRNR